VLSAVTVVRRRGARWRESQRRFDVRLSGMWMSILAGEGLSSLQWKGRHSFGGTGCCDGT
jgi:hypothetical protein